MHAEEYKNQIEHNMRFRDLYEKDYVRRMEFARDNGCNTVILTGDGEPLMNRSFLKDFAHWNGSLNSPFKWIELQTSGVTLDDECLRFLRNTVGVSTIALSLSDLFSDEVNATTNVIPKKLQFKIEALCQEIKRYDFNLRLSLNLMKWHEFKICNHEIINRAKELGANQFTFRLLYKSGLGLPQDEFITEHGMSCEGSHGEMIRSYIKENGKELEKLPYGAVRYSLKGISVVLDDDCMSKNNTEAAIKYLVLRPNCKLYTKWDDEGSLLF